jgi:hypothetical protein
MFEKVWAGIIDMRTEFVLSKKIRVRMKYNPYLTAFFFFASRRFWEGLIESRSQLENMTIGAARCDATNLEHSD